jgi:hypothetical protein
MHQSLFVSILLSLCHGYFCLTKSVYHHFRRIPLFSISSSIEEEAPATSTTPVTALEQSDKYLDLNWQAETYSTSDMMICSSTLHSYFSNPNLPFNLSASHVNITHISGNNYMSVSPSINVFGNEFIPVLFYQVTQEPSNKFVSMKVMRSEMRGGSIAQKISEFYSLTSNTEISAKSTTTTAADHESYQVSARADIRVNIRFPKEKNKIPIRVLKSAGNYLLQNYLNTLGPNLLKNIVADIIKLQFALTV